jgi:biotin carboxyl carrier protein
VATASGVVEEVLVVTGSDVARGEPVVRVSSWQ